MRPPLRAVADDDVDRPQVGAWRHVEPSGTNGPKARGRAGDAPRRPLSQTSESKGSESNAIVEQVWEVRESKQGTQSVVQDSLSCLDMPRETSGGYGAGAHLFPSRTEKLSPAAAMILRETVGK